jgi:Bacterial SH3 domain
MNEPETTKQNWVNAISNVFQFILGFFLGVALIAGSAVAVAYYYFTKVSSTVPEKPVYTEETSPKAQVVEETTEATIKSTEKESQVENVAPVSSETETESTTEENIPDGAYYATVTWSEGLSLRAEPNVNAAKIGGIDYNSKILILEESSDKQWQKVQIPWSQQEGWVKAGNVERASY